MSTKRSASIGIMSAFLRQASSSFADNAASYSLNPSSLIQTHLTFPVVVVVAAVGGFGGGAAASTGFGFGFSS